MASLTGQGRAVRLGGIAPSAGAAASLVGALVALSLLASSLLGVRLWPGGPGGDAGRLTLPAVPVVAHHPAATHVRVHAETAAPAVRPARVAAAHPGAAHPRAAHHVARPHAHRRAAAPAPTATATPAPPAASTPAPTPASVVRPAATPSHRTPLPAVPTPAAPRHVVQLTVTTVRQTTQPVVNVLPPAVQTPVATVEDTLEQTAGAVDQALAPVTGRLPVGR